MNNDLISRSELRQALCEFMKNNIGIYSNEMFHLVDSMPTAEERPQGEFVKMVNERIEKMVCKWCQMNKHCELCEISRVFMIIALIDEEMKGGAKG